MSGKVKVKVADHHTRTSITVDGKKATKTEAVKVDKDNVTVRNCLEAGSLEVVEKFQEPDNNEAGEEHDTGGETGEEDEQKAGEEEEGEQDTESEEDDNEEIEEDDDEEEEMKTEEHPADQYEYSELQAKASDTDVRGDLKKVELYERLEEEGHLDDES